MIRKRILSLLVCAALLCGVLAGCSTSSGSTAGPAEKLDTLPLPALPLLQARASPLPP